MKKIINTNIFSLKGIGKQRIILVITIFLLGAFGFAYIRLVWVESINATIKNALKITQTAEAGFSGYEIGKLDVSPKDLKKHEYKQIKNSLIEVRGMNENVGFVYIYIQKKGKIYFVADSEPVNSKDYSPPGQLYKEARNEDLKPFSDGKAFIEQPYSDRWGTWVSILVPIKDYETGKTIAVFGMDYPAKLWKTEAASKTEQAGFFVAVVYMLLISFYIILMKNNKMKKSQILVKESEKRLLSAQLMAHVGSWEINLETNTVWASEEALNIYGFEHSSEYLTLESVQERVLPEYRESLDLALKGLLTKNKRYDLEFKIKNVITGEEQFVHSRAELVTDDNCIPHKVAGTIQDISERKKKEEKIFYLSYYDQLTGLYNRRFYEEELKRLDTKRNLPLTIVIGDVNGLKLINDSFGHAKGDELLKKVAELLKLGCRADDIIARLGGDEFIILLPKTDSSCTKQIVARLKSMISNEKFGSFEISISLGYETKNHLEENIQEVFNKAEDYMYKKKLNASQSMRAKTIDAIITTLHEKNKREEQHSKRVSILCKRLGEVLNLSEEKIERLKTAGLLHDIGKIAINEDILDKPGKLTEDEFNEIKRHPEIGYRILNTVNEMSDLANYILYHHERWDGRGYPRGLKREEIPFTSRIITIADAYDAMASERNYRNVLPEKVIIEELQKNAGKQFDPALVSIFIEKILGIDGKFKEL